ncbi:MAG TPA: group II intron reverse transcriptase/maturase [Candidatus Cloacimonadota bacterium]|nr:group II intron reverse transcriptase/maturase [Candidatus Cloacimonadota bacterium]
MEKKWYSLIDKVYKEQNLFAAFAKVKLNRGTCGVDKQTIDDFEANLTENILLLHLDLKNRDYSPQPVRRVEIPKGNGKTRPLGIPTVRDRVVQQAILNVIQPIFEPDFHPSSYGYRPGRSCQKAVAKAQSFLVIHGLPFVVDMDLSKCFDSLNHEKIMQGLNRKISDGTLLRLIEKMLKSGTIEMGNFAPTEIGSPQGGVISPLLMNIYLDEFDQYMKGLGIRIVRYADDILIFAPTMKKAERYFKIASDKLHSMLLTVNVEKTHISNVDKGVKYLGFVIHRSYIRIDDKRIKQFKDKVRSMTPRNSGINAEEMILNLNKYLRGWGNYFRLADCKTVFSALMEWIRRRLRMKKMREWKSWKAFHQQLRRNGYKGNYPKISMRRWVNSACKLIHMALPNSWFNDMGLFKLNDLRTSVLFNYYE